jgi:methionyl-tRNA synthetase
MQRVDMKQLDALFEPPAGAPAPQPPRGERGSLPGARRSRPRSRIDDFAKIDLRIAKIVECKAVEGRPSCCS